MSDYSKFPGAILAAIGEPCMLEQLAEEAAELAQAALKLARVLRGKNPTPVTEDEARANLSEEANDVYLCLKEIGIRHDWEMIYAKRKRFQERVERTKDKEA